MSRCQAKEGPGGEVVAVVAVVAVAVVVVVVCRLRCRLQMHSRLAQDPLDLCSTKLRGGGDQDPPPRLLKNSFMIFKTIKVFLSKQPLGEQRRLAKIR